MGRRKYATHINGSFVVRWEDKNGKQHRREYTTETDARKAKQWLLDNGALSVDIAIRINDKTVGSLGDKEKPAKIIKTSQKGFWSDDRR